MSDFTTITACRSCSAEDLRAVLDLGNQPLANSYPPLESDLSEPRYPLKVVRCGRCSLVQLRSHVDPRVMFDDYLYFSSFSTAMTASVQALAERLVREQALDADDLVLEVASNDGYLLQHYLRHGVPVLGVDPAANVAAVAEAAGVPTIVDYFGRRLADQLVAEGRTASVLHANNVLGHVPDIRDFVDGIARVLRPDGLAVVETPWLVQLVDACEFDTIYHEHVYYHSLTALEHLFGRYGLSVVDVELLLLHGGSLRLSIAKDGRAASGTVAELRAREEASGVADDRYYADFADRVARLKEATLRLLDEQLSAGSTVAAYGAAAKGTVLLNHFGIDAERVAFVVDRNTHKHGRRMPGVRIPIRGPEALLEERPDVVLLLAWNFAPEILDQQQAFRAAGGRFLVPVPEPRLV